MFAILGEFTRIVLLFIENRFIESTAALPLLLLLIAAAPAVIPAEAPANPAAAVLSLLAHLATGP